MTPVSRHSLRVILATGIAALLAPTGAKAASYTYTGPGAGTATTPVTGNFNVGDSWVGETVPIFDSTTDLIFNYTAGTAANLTATNDIGTISLNSLSVTNNRATSVITISGGTLNFVADSGTSELPTITNTATSSQVMNINSAINLGANLTIANNGTGQIQIGNSATAGAGNINLNNFTLTLTNTASASGFQFGQSGGSNRGVISGTGSIVQTMANAAQTNAFFGASTFSGGYTLNSGILVIGTNSAGSVGAVTSGAIGTGLLTINGGTIRATSNGNRSILNDVSVAGNFTLGDATTTGMTLAGNMTLTGNRTITVTGGGSATDLTNRHAITGVISDGGSAFNLSKTGSGSLVLSGASTYSGTTNILNGAILVAANVPSGSASPLGNATSAISVGGTGSVNGGFLGLYVGVPGSTPGASTITIARDIAVGNANGAGGSTTLGTISDTNAVFSGNISLAKSVQLNSASTGSRLVDFTGIVSGAGFGVTKIAAGTARLSNVNTYTGTTTIRAGTLLAGGNVQVSTDGVFGNSASAIALGDAASVPADNIILGIDGAFTIGRDISVTAINSAGLSTLTAQNAAATTATYSGNVSIAKGVVLGNATAGATTLFTGAISDGAGTFGVTINGPGTVEFGGPGVHAYDGGTTISSGTLKLNRAAGGNNTITGAVTISGGTLLLGANEQLPDTTVLTLTSGTFDAANLAETIFDLNYTGGTILNGGNLTITGSQDRFLFDGTTVSAAETVNRHILYLGSATAATVNAALALDNDATHDLTVNDGAAAVDVVFNAAITNDGTNTPTSLIKKGAGTVKFNAANTFGGAGKTLEIQSGVVEVTANDQFGDAANTVTLNGGTLRFGGSFATGRTFVFGAGNGTLETPTGVAQTISALSGPGSLIKSGAGELIISGDNSASYSGVTNVNAGTLTVSTLNNLLGNASNDLVINGGTLKVATGFAVDAGKTITIGASGAGIQVEPSQTLDLSAADNLAGGGILTKTGNGVLLIRDANAGLTAGSAVNLNAGAIELRNAQSLGNTVKSAVTLSGGQLRLTNDAATSFSNPVVIASGTGAVQSDVATNGAAAVSHTLGTLSLGGTLMATAGGNATGTPGIIFGVTTLTANATINADTATVTTGAMGLGANSLAVSGARNTQLGAVSGGPGAGNTAITKTGNGTLVLANTGTFTGNTVVNGGVVRGNTTGAFGNSANIVRANAGGTVGMGISAIPNAIEFNGGTLASTGITTGTWNGLAGTTPSITFLADTIFNLWDPLSPSTDADVNLGSGSTGVVTSVGAVNITVNANATNTTFATQKKLQFQNTTNSGNATGTLTVNPNAIGQIRGAGAVNALGSGVLLKLNTGVNLTTPENAGRLEFIAESDTMFGNDIQILGDSTIGVGRITSATGRLLTANNLSIGNHTLAVIDATAGGASAYNLAFAGTTSLSGNPTFHNLRTLTLGPITDGAGTFGFTKTGVGTLILNSASSTFDGDINVNAGTVNVGVNDAVPDSVKINIAGGNFTFSNGVNTSRADTVANITMTSGTLRTANGTTPTQTQVTVTNTLEIAGGDFQVNTGTAVSANKVILSGGVQNLHVIGGNSTVTPSELIVGAGGLEFTGSQLRMNFGQATGNLGSRVTLNGNVFTFASSLEAGFWGSSSGTNIGVREINVGTGTRAFFVEDGSVTNDLRVDFPLVGTANVVKIGEGRMQVAAANTYSGDTVISQGTLGLGASATLAGSPSVHVGVGATFDVSAKGTGYNVLASQSLKVDGTLLGSANVSGSLSGSGTISENVTVLDAGVLAPGASPGVLGIGGTLDFSDNAIFNVEIGGAAPGNGTGRYDQVNVGLGVTVGANVALNLSLSGGYVPTLANSFFVLTREDFVDYSTFFQNASEGATVDLGNGFTGTITYAANWTGDQLTSTLTGGNDVAIFSVVPEPGSAMLLLGGMAIMANCRRRRS